MNEQDKKAFAELMVGSGEVYNKQVSKSLMQFYFDALKQYSIDEVKAGFGKHALDPEHGTFFPKPADVVRNAQKSDLSAEDKAELAWAQVMREMRSTGSYGSLNLDDKQAIAAVKALGSWQQLCSSTDKEMTWKKKEFISIYQTYEKTPVEFLPSSLPGRIELVEHKKQESEAFARLKAGIQQHRLNKG